MTKHEIAHEIAHTRGGYVIVDKKGNEVSWHPTVGTVMRALSALYAVPYTRLSGV